MASAESTVAPYTVTRYCLCRKPVDSRKKVKCKRCQWNFCSQACRTLYSREHKISCGTNNALNVFINANARFLAIYGIWLRVHPDFNYVGMRIDVKSAHEEVKATPLEQQSLEILLKDVNGKPEMRSAGYPDSFICIIAWKGAKVCIEIDLVQGGNILLGNSPDFDLAANHKFILTPMEAADGKTRDAWKATFRPSLIKRDWQNFAMWKAMQALPK